MPTDIQNLQPAELGFSPHQWPDFRPAQRAMLERILSSSKKFIIIQAPPGSGKSLVAFSIGRLTNQRVMYAVHSKTLQDQVEREARDYIFPRERRVFSGMLKGRANYATLNYPEDFPEVSAESCTLGRKTKAGSETVVSRSCLYCADVPRCPYIAAKRQALDCEFSILNISMFLRISKSSQFRVPDPFGSGQEISFSYTPWLVIDEADMLEHALTGFIELHIGKEWPKRLGIGEPEKKTAEESWLFWVQSKALPRAEAMLEMLKEVDPPTSRQAKEQRWLEDTIEKMKRFLARVHVPVHDARGDVFRYACRTCRQERVNAAMGAELPIPQDLVYYEAMGRESAWQIFRRHHLDAHGSEPEHWVFNADTVTFKPVMVDKDTEEHLWKRAGRVVLMSGTILSVDQFCIDLGIDRADADFVDIQESFSAARRPVWYTPGPVVSAKTKSFAFDSVTHMIDDILDRHIPIGRKCLVHTHSYEFAKHIMHASKHQGSLITYLSGRERSRALGAFITASDGVALIAPSLERGLDFPDDLCRCIILAKCPFPNLGDKQVAARLYETRNGKAWYRVQTVRSIVQATGRGMRHQSDWCMSYILDGSFERLLRENRGMFPRWWLDGLHMPQD